jgi:hypothetical protein
MSNNLHQRLNDLADEMTGTNYTTLRRQVESTSRRIGRRHAIAVAVAGFVAVVAVAGGGYALGSRQTGAGPAGTGTSPTAPAPSTAPASPSTTVVPANAVPGTLVYLSVRTGQPITMTTVTDGVAHRSTFGMATASDEHVLVPSPDATRLAAIESPDPGNIKPGDLVIVSAGGARHTIATGVVWGGGNVPVWLPDGQHIIATVGNRSSVIDVTTGQAAAAQPAEGNQNYLTWSANGQRRAYGLSTDVVVTAADGSGAVRRSVGSLRECQQQAGCPTSVQAVSDDGRYVAVGHMNSDPSHVNEAHLVLDMHTGTLVNLPAVPNGAVNKVYFRVDGGMIVRTVTNDGRYTFVLLRPDGSTIATFPDTQEQHPGGRHLVAYHP